MVAILDKFGRVVIPQKIRRALGLRPGLPLEIEEFEDRMVIRAASEDSPLTMKQGVLVFTGKVLGDVVHVIAQAREERLKKAGGL